MNKLMAAQRYGNAVRSMGQGWHRWSRLSTWAGVHATDDGRDPNGDAGSHPCWRTMVSSATNACPGRRTRSRARLFAKWVGAMEVPD